MRFVAHLRTSGLGQVDKQGPGVQEDACRAYAAARGWTVVTVLNEAATTGTTDERPCWAEALVMVERGEADGVVLSSLDRLARTLTVQDALQWRAGAEVHAANFGLVAEDDPDDPMRTAMRQMASVFAQLDKSMTVLRLRRAREEKAPPASSSTSGASRSAKAPTPTGSVPC